MLVNAWLSFPYANEPEYILPEGKDRPSEHRVPRHPYPPPSSLVRVVSSLILWPPTFLSGSPGLGPFGNEPSSYHADGGASPPRRIKISKTLNFPPVNPKDSALTFQPLCRLDNRRSISALRECVCPPAIARFVVSIIVYPVNRFPFRPQSHVRKEIFKSRPPIANKDSSSAISMKIFMLRVCASLMNLSPEIIEASFWRLFKCGICNLPLPFSEAWNLKLNFSGHVVSKNVSGGERNAKCSDWPRSVAAT